MQSSHKNLKRGGENPLPTYTIIIKHQTIMDKENQQRTRRTYAKRGQRSQTMMSFRIDNELIEWLTSQHNMGRYINELIEEDMKHVLNL